MLDRSSWWSWNAIPCLYAYRTRYREHLKFVVLFEWFPCVLVSLLFGNLSFSAGLAKAILCYVAFLCIYEIGYIVNDYYAVIFDEFPRDRGSSTGTIAIPALWCVLRISVFLLLTSYLAMRESSEWWCFYGFLIVTFSAHNLFRSSTLKCCSFFWLAMCRFQAALFFTLKPEFAGSALFVGATSYALFRTLSYLESKSLLTMPGRRQPSFRLTFFALPLPLALYFFIQDGWNPFTLFSVYYFVLNLSEIGFQKYGKPYFPSGTISPPQVGASIGPPLGKSLRGGDS